MAQEKTRYSPEELEEFRKLIEKRLKEAREEYEELKQSLQSVSEAAEASNLHDITDRGSDMLAKQELEILMMRTLKFIRALERALVRIENGTYGICKVTGKLIPKERLLRVPHAETTVEAKMMQYQPKPQEENNENNNE